MHKATVAYEINTPLCTMWYVNACLSKQLFCSHQECNSFFHQVCLQHHHSVSFSMHFLSLTAAKKLVLLPNTRATVHVRAEHIYACMCVCRRQRVRIEARVFGPGEKCMNYGRVYSHIIVSFRVTHTDTTTEMSNNDYYVFICKLLCAYTYVWV